MNLDKLDMYAVAIYDRETEVLTLTKEAAHSPLVAARVALANFFIDDDISGFTDFTRLRDAMLDYDLEMEVICLVCS